MKAPTTKNKNKKKQKNINSPHTAFAPYRSRTQASILHAGWAPILLPARRALVWGQPEGTFPHLQPPHLPAEAHNDFGGTLFLFLLLLVHHDFLLPVILLRLQEPQRTAPRGEVGGKSAASTRGWQGRLVFVCCCFFLWRKMQRQINKGINRRLPFKECQKYNNKNMPYVAIKLNLNSVEYWTVERFELNCAGLLQNLRWLSFQPAPPSGRKRNHKVKETPAMEWRSTGHEERRES